MHFTKRDEISKYAGFVLFLFGNYFVDKMENIGNIVKLRKGCCGQKLIKKGR